MESPIVPRDLVAQNLATSRRVLLRYEERGLVRAVRQGSVEGYPPAEIRRIWTILSCQRDLGINLAGVEAILKLKDHLAQVHQQLGTLASELREMLEAEAEDEAEAPNNG